MLNNNIYACIYIYIYIYIQQNIMFRQELDFSLRVIKLHTIKCVVDCGIAPCILKLGIQ